MFNEKPILSNQHGALVMAFLPYFYGIVASEWIFPHLWLGLAWLFLYFFSYPFLSIFSKKQTAKYQKWAVIYAVIAAIFAIPLLLFKFSILQFLLPILPLVLVQIHYAKQHDERHLLNDIAGILTFGVVGMASFYLATDEYNFVILLHPTLFFIATTFYIKSVARERKNPRYLKLSLASHLVLGTIYALCGQFAIAIAYLVGFMRAFFVPKQKWSIKQVGMLEFVIITIFFIGLIFS